MARDRPSPLPAVTRRSTRVWDWPTRLTHWLVAILVPLSWATAEFGWLDWHKASGYAILGLVAFRIYWGFNGATTARFTQFVRGPAAVGRYLREFFGRSRHAAGIGHNPAGGWSILAMLFLLLLQVGLGLFAVDEYGMQAGPLAPNVSFETGRWIAGLHETGFNVLLALIVLHVAAVAAHFVIIRDNLVGPMLTGKKRASEDAVSVSAGPVWRVLIGVAGSALLVAIVAYLL